MAESRPWQLLMFDKTLKKKQRFHALTRLLGEISPDERCLLVTCGDNNGAMNYHLREIGGQWTWADFESRSIPEMSSLLGDDVIHVVDDRLPLDDDSFDRVITIDVHEHIDDPHPFTKELARITRDGGQVVITTPGGDQRKLANVLKNFVGMRKEKYGHARDGLSASELRELLEGADLNFTADRSFSRFFTELVELGINFLYVNILSKKKDVEVEEGTIAPATGEQLKSVGKAYHMYSLAYPFFWLFSRLDLLLFFTRGYVEVAAGRKGDAH